MKTINLSLPLGQWTVITAALEELPAKFSRQALNRIEQVIDAHKTQIEAVLSVEDWNVIVHALNERPAKLVHITLNELERQFLAQKPE